MSDSFTLLRNQLNNSNEFIRPMTVNSIIRAISVLERSATEEGGVEDTRTVLLLSTLITQLSGGLVSDFQAIRQFLDAPSSVNSACRPVFEELVAEMFVMRV